MTKQIDTHAAAPNPDARMKWSKRKLADHIATLEALQHGHHNEANKHLRKIAELEGELFAERRRTGAVLQAVCDVAASTRALTERRDATAP